MRLPWLIVVVHDGIIELGESSRNDNASVVSVIFYAKRQLKGSTNAQYFLKTSGERVLAIIWRLVASSLQLFC